MISKVRGRFSSFTGTIEVGEDITSTSVSASIDLASIDTGDDNRDTHLRGADLFDAESFPTMTFTSTEVRPAGGDYVLVGDLTIKGVTRSVELEVEFEGTQGDPWGGTRVGFSAEGEINRKDWGLEWNVALETGGVLVGDKIKLQLEIEAVKA
jgi:polyisoprenoid-binding protein YceI